MDIKEIPLGLGMALAQRPEAMEKFAKMPKEKQQEIINGTHSMHSKQEMQNYVDSLISSN